MDSWMVAWAITFLAGLISTAEIGILLHTEKANHRDTKAQLAKKMLTPEPQKYFAVLASMREFEHFLRRNVAPSSRHKYLRVGRADQVRGVYLYDFIVIDVVDEELIQYTSSRIR